MIALRGVAFLFVLGTMLPLTVGAATISVQPANTNAMVDDVFTLTIQGSDFTTALDAGGFDVSWDPAVLALGPSGLMLDPVWDPTISDPGVPGSGSVTDVLFFASGVSPSGVFNIATIEFQAIATGSSMVSLVESMLNPPAGGGGPLEVDYTSGAVTVAGDGGPVIPEPSTVVLFGAGLLGIAALKARRHKAPAAKPRRRS